MNFYNDNEPFAAEWLRRLIAGGELAEGVVDERGIGGIEGSELSGFTQAHFFAGMGGWPLALRLAGWPESEPVWTGSCPCQPFSNAGKRGGVNDERHLWPEWLRLIAECQPPVIFGEQVASGLGREWLSAVRTDLEALGYAVGGADLCAASVGAPHIRQRLFFVAHTIVIRSSDGKHTKARWPTTTASECGGVIGVVNAAGEQVGLPGRAREPGSADSGVGDAGREGRRQVSEIPERCGEGSRAEGLAERSLHECNGNPWSDLNWLPCIDGKFRPTKPGLFPLAHGVSARVAKLRAIGNAIVPQIAAQFIIAARASIYRTE